MTHSEAIDKLISVRHYCFLRGVLHKFPNGERDQAGHQGLNEDFRQAFRTLNRLYVALKADSGMRRGILRARKARKRPTIGIAA